VGMAVHKQTPSEALFGNLISFGIGFGIGRGISGAGQLAGRNADNVNVRGGNNASNTNPPTRNADDVFHSKHDPVFEYLGQALGNPRFDAEVRNIIKHIKSVGGEVNINYDRARTRMAYGPRATPGEPGGLVIDDIASISAWRHEYDHFLYDQEQGFPGMRYLFENEDIRWEAERRAYQREIDTAIEFGIPAVIPRLAALRQEARISILGD